MALFQGPHNGRQADPKSFISHDSTPRCMLAAEGALDAVRHLLDAGVPPRSAGLPRPLGERWMRLDEGENLAPLPCDSEGARDRLARGIAPRGHRVSRGDRRRPNVTAATHPGAANPREEMVAAATARQEWGDEGSPLPRWLYRCHQTLGYSMRAHTTADSHDQGQHHLSNTPCIAICRCAPMQVNRD